MTRLEAPVRHTFRTSRLLDFASEKELVAQTGHPTRDWPLVAVKELLDNALDAAEGAGIAPVVAVTVRPGGGIRVVDNGPGLPQSTLDGVLDFTVRVSSREAYVGPTRGAQGNALKTIVCMPFVLDGERGDVKVRAGGVCATIKIGIDRIRQTPTVEREVRPDPAFVKNGTSLMLAWPDSACSTLGAAEGRFLQIADDYAWLNPHLSLSVRWSCRPTTTSEATAAAWTKWRPSDPACPHWFTTDRLKRLMAAYLAHDADAGRERTVREFVAEFRGMTSSARQKAVVDAAGLSRATLVSLVKGGDLDVAAVTRLLGEMQSRVKPVKPEALGVLGSPHLRQRFADAGCDGDSFAYKKVAGTTAGVPWVVEVAFAAHDSAFEDSDEEVRTRRLVLGVNWSPAIVNPFREIGDGHSLESLLADVECGSQEPVVVFLHVACARVEFTDRGKSSVVADGFGRAVIDAITATTKAWSRQRKAEQREASRASRRAQAFKRNAQVTIRDAAFDNMPRAYLKASAGGTLPTLARQMYYAIRDAVQESTGKALDAQYFSQVLLPDFMSANPESTRSWDVVFDARGHLHEPHTGRIVPLGTLDVRGYLDGATSDGDALDRVRLGEAFPTAGHRNRYGAILFIEKEGFNPLFERAQLTRRYDVALMSQKGLSTTAGRLLVDEVCGRRGLPLLVLRDFDKAGFSIVATLRNDTRRYAFANERNIVDLGVRLADVEANDLKSEAVFYGKSDPVPNLMANGATPAEAAFLCAGRGYDRGYQGRRVELNAFMPDELMAWIERKLVEHGVGKVIPDDAVLARAWHRAAATTFVNERLGALIAEGRSHAARLAPPADLHARIAAALSNDPSASWDAVVADVARGQVRRERGHR